jgi:RNA polymerase sigma-70 factor (ECF subfamily)
MSHAARLPVPVLPVPLAGDECDEDATPVAPKDQDLIERAARGETEAFTILYRRYERPVFGVLLRLAGRRPLAEEWLQEAFTRVWLAAGTHDPSRGAAKSWIFAIALNTARSHLNRKAVRTPHVPLDALAGEPPDRGAPGEGQIADALDGERRAQAVRDAVAGLPDFMREVVVLRCSRELSFAEIAEVTGAPQGTLKSRFHRAVGVLRARLSGEAAGERRRR